VYYSKTLKVPSPSSWSQLTVSTDYGRAKCACEPTLTTWRQKIHIFLARKQAWTLTRERFYISSIKMMHTGEITDGLISVSITSLNMLTGGRLAKKATGT
jgi:hypothetical protein